MYQACLKLPHTVGVYVCVYTELQGLSGKFLGTVEGNRFGVRMSFEDMLVKHC